MRYFILIAVLMLALPAAAADGWSQEQDGTRNCSVLSAGTCYYDFSGTTDSKTLAISSKCMPVSVSLNPDEDGTNTGAEIQLYRCNDRGTFSTTICPSKILADTDGDGLLNDVTLDGNTVGRIGLSDLSTRWVGIDITANPAGDDFRITAECR